MGNPSLTTPIRSKITWAGFNLRFFFGGSKGSSRVRDFDFDRLVFGEKNRDSSLECFFSVGRL